MNKFNEKWFITAINEKVSNHKKNIYRLHGIEDRYFGDPIIGFAAGDDPIFNEYKEIIGAEHYTPCEIMKWHAENRGMEPPPPEEISVVSYVLPVTKATKDDNSSCGEWLARRWAMTRLYGEEFNRTISEEIVLVLNENNIPAVAPELTPLFKRVDYAKAGMGSNWSHRHIAYAAGLGTFGIHDFLITEKGAAHRCGSFVVNLRLKPDRKRNADKNAYCLHYQKIKCLKCSARCPINAINAKGHDKNRCSERVDKSHSYCRENYGLDIYGCGLCSTGVPCESGIPAELQHNR